MSTAIEMGWFVAGMIGLYCAIKYLGPTRTLWWTFAFSSLICLWLALPYILRIVHRNYTSLTLRSLLTPGVFTVLTTIYGVACWTGWKRKPSASTWAIAASLTYVVLPLFTISSRFYFGRSLRGCGGVMLGVGLVGLVTFMRQGKPYGPTKNGTDS